MKKVDLLSGETLRSTKAEQRHFGEGLTRWGDQLIQLTWKGPTVLIYNASELKLMRESKTDLKDGLVGGGGAVRHRFGTSLAEENRNY